MNADEVRPLLPALVHLARFPTANLRVVCERWGVDAARVTAGIREVESVAGHAGGFDDELLARACKRWKLSVPAFQALPPPREKPAPASPAVARANGPDVRAARKPDPRAVGPRVTVPEPSPVPPEVVGRPRRKDDFYLAVCVELLQGGGRLSEGEACTRHGLGSSTWIYFKKMKLGLGPIDPAKLHKVICELAQKLNVEKVPGMPSEWATPARYGPGARPQACGAKSAVLAEIAGKERRHLVASLAVGLLAWPHPLPAPDLIGMAFGLYDELVKQDRAREGGAA